MISIKNLLPVGSVVKIKDSEKALAIIGILVNNDGIKYDYIAVPSPEGYIDAEHMYVFNHEDVEKVDFLGYMNSEFQIFRRYLVESLEKISEE